MSPTLLISEAELEKMIAAAVAEEREACAKVAEQGARVWADNKRVADVLSAAAADIRARKDVSR